MFCSTLFAEGLVKISLFTYHQSTKIDEAFGKSERMSNQDSTAGVLPCKENAAIMPFEMFFLGELRAEGIISDELFSYAAERLRREKIKEEELER